MEQTSHLPSSGKRGLIELLASLEPLPPADMMPQIEDSSPEPVTCFDDWDEAKSDPF